MAFSIQDGIVVYEKDVLDMSADEALSDGQEESALTEAEEWLRQFLAGGRQKAETVFKSAKTDRIAEKTLRRAAKKLKVKHRREGYGEMGIYYWELP